MKNNNKKESEKVFGVCLDKHSASSPLCLDVWIDYLLNHGVDEEGLFRLSGQVTVRDELKKAIDQGEEIKWEQYSPHDVAGILKLYFRDLPDPLFTYSLYSRFMAAVACKKDPENNLEGIRKVLVQLPPGHRIVLQKLVAFLLMIIKHKENNKMGPEALARIFAPTLMRPPNDDMQATLADCSFQISLVRTVIENYDFMFSSEEEEISEKTMLRAQLFKTLVENRYLKNEVDMSNKFAIKMISRYAKIRKASTELVKSTASKESAEKPPERLLPPRRKITVSL